MEVSYEHPNGILPTCAYFSRLASNKKAYLLAAAEAGSIHIKREVVAECDNAVMLYSIGKDSSVLLHLAMKAFYPALPPFPLLHVDTTWKFRAMYDFRDATGEQAGREIDRTRERRRPASRHQSDYPWFSHPYRYHEN